MSKMTRQYVVDAQVNGYRVVIGFLTEATTGQEAKEKTQRHIDRNGKFAAVKNRCRVATAQDLNAFKDYPKAVLS